MVTSFVMASRHHPGKGHTRRCPTMDKFWNGTFKFIFAVIGVVFAFSMLQVVWHYYHTIILLGLIATAIVWGLVLRTRARARRNSQANRPTNGGGDVHNHYH